MVGEKTIQRVDDVSPWCNSGLRGSILLKECPRDNCCSFVIEEPCTFKNSRIIFYVLFCTLAFSGKAKQARGREKCQYGILVEVGMGGVGPISFIHVKYPDWFTSERLIIIKEGDRSQIDSQIEV